MEIRLIPSQPLRNGDTVRELEWVHKRINEVFTKGKIEMQRVLTAEGDTGNQIINENAGVVRFAAGATTLVVTNSKVDENSIIFCVLMTNDTTAVLKNVVPASGYFTIKLSAAANAETRCGFVIFN